MSLGDVPLDDLSAEALADMLARHGFAWRVVVVSACYSGGFIEPLSDDGALVITAASADSTSFGCSDEAEMTHFGRAFFQIALNQTHDFSDAFELARKQVEIWERDDDITPSHPQIAAPEPNPRSIGVVGGNGGTGAAAIVGGVVVE